MLHAPPTLVIVAGPNGSGKTTIMRHLRKTGVDLGVYVNADDMAAAMTPSADRDRLAQENALAIRQECLRDGTSFSFETVMSHPSRIDELAEARRLGFRITLVFVGTSSPQINVDRVAQRVEEGGHDVPRDRIVARYQRTMALLPDAVRESHRALIFDNSEPLRGHLLICQVDEDETGRKTVMRRLPNGWLDRHLPSSHPALRT